MDWLQPAGLGFACIGAAVCPGDVCFEPSSETEEISKSLQPAIGPMQKRMTSRCLTGWAMVVVLAGLSVSAAAQRRRPRAVFVQNRQAPAPIVRRPPPARQPEMQGPPPIERRNPPGNGGAGRAGGGGHLAQWMNQHSGLSLAQQQQLLQREPGFRELPMQTQQRYLNRLAQLNAMPPAERQRTLARTEWMEHLNPDQRAQVRGATEQLGGLPPDQRRVVARDFRQLRDLPPGERGAVMNSEQYRGQLNPAQMDTLRNLMRVEPLMPPSDRVEAPPPEF
jgi:hypothetical protein